MADLLRRFGVSSERSDELGHDHRPQRWWVIPLPSDANLADRSGYVVIGDQRSAERRLFFGRHAWQCLDHGCMASACVTWDRGAQWLRRDVLRNRCELKLSERWDRDLRRCGCWLTGDAHRDDDGNFVHHYWFDQRRHLCGPGHPNCERSRRNGRSSDRYSFGQCGSAGSVPHCATGLGFGDLDVARSGGHRGHHRKRIHNSVLERRGDVDDLHEPQCQPARHVGGCHWFDERHALLLPGHSGVFAKLRFVSVDNCNATKHCHRSKQCGDEPRGVGIDADVERTDVIGWNGIDRLSDLDCIVTFRTVDHSDCEYGINRNVVPLYWTHTTADVLLRGGCYHRRRDGRGVVGSIGNALWSTSSTNWFELCCREPGWNPVVGRSDEYWRVANRWL